MGSETGRPGKVYLVGAGPGDPGLITLRAVRCLERADLILYDYLVNPATLEHAPASAERLCLGHPGDPGREKISPEEVRARMIAAAREGKTVVRLKSGDPVVFGRGGDEVRALRRAAVRYETVSGVTAATAAAGYTEIPLTHPEHGSAVALVTGQESHRKTGPPLDYAGLAHFPGTLVFYMGVRSARQWSQPLISGGKPPSTPVMIVRRCTWPDQSTVRCTLGTVAEVIAEQGIGPPALIVVGDVAGLAPEASWFAQRPLAGTRVMVTRPREQAAGLAALLAELGAEVLLQPAIAIGPPDDWSAVDEAIDRIPTYDWLVFSSANGVRYLLDRIWHRGKDLRELAPVRVAAIGPGTAEELARYRIRADRVPETYRAEALAEALVPAAEGNRFLLARASRGREVLAQMLAEAGAAVDQVVVYSSRDVESPSPEAVQALAEGQIDWVAVTSSAIARSLVRLFGDQLRRTNLASISPVTSDVLGRLGHPPAIEAEPYTMGGLVQAIVDANRPD